MTTPAPYVPPAREIYIPPHVFDNWFEPAYVPPPPPPVIKPGGLDQMFADAAEQGKREEAQKALDVLTRASGEPAPPAKTTGGGMRINLPATAKPSGSPKEFIYKGFEIAWDGAKWVAKHPFEAAYRGLNYYGVALSAIDIATWAYREYRKVPGYKPPPRVDTSYSFSGNMGMKYKHFDGSWHPFPPPGYDRFGALIK